MSRIDSRITRQYVGKWPRTLSGVTGGIVVPVSHHYQISTICDVIHILRPSSVLDIGIGFGKYGLLARELLDIEGADDDYQHRQHLIDGVEVYPDYIGPWQKEIYDHIFIGDARTVLESLPETYDLALAIDVIEHIPKADALALLNMLRTQGGDILISTPKDIGIHALATRTKRTFLSGAREISPD